jgi:hypothetical protein
LSSSRLRKNSNIIGFGKDTTSRDSGKILVRAGFWKGTTLVLPLSHQNVSALQRLGVGFLPSSDFFRSLLKMSSPTFGLFPAKSMNPQVK